MSARLRLPSSLRRFAGGEGVVDVDAVTVAAALEALVARHPELRAHLYDDVGGVRSFVNVFVNEDNVRDLAGLETPLASGDELSIVPSLAGGAPDAAAPARPAPAERAPLPDLERAERLRYSRHIVLPEVGEEGQRRLKGARVLLVGAGGLGSPAALYLAAAGIGTLGVVDFDVVDASNLQRQVLHGTSDVGRSKLSSARDRLAEVNPHVVVEPHETRLTSANAMEIVSAYDVVLDGADNFPTRYLVNDACVLLGRPNVHGSIFRWEGQVSVFGAPGGPCYRCLFREPPPPGAVPSCAEGGVLGVLPGVVGSLQAMEVIKGVLGVGEPLVGRLAVYDALAAEWRTLRVRPDPACPLCGDEPTIRELVDYEAFCGLSPAAADDAPASLQPTELGARLERGEPLTLLDVREPHEWALGNLAEKGARHIPLGELPDRLGELDREARVVVCCRSGGRSGQACRILRAEGFERVWNLEGGLTAWARSVDPTLPVA